MAEARKANPLPTEAGCHHRLTHRRTTDGRRSLHSLKHARAAAPPSHLASEGTRAPSFSASSSSREELVQVDFGFFFDCSKLYADSFY